MEITRGRLNKPYKVVIYGPEGIGKTTFASQFPEPLFIDTEGSTARMDVARLPVPNTWSDILDAIRWIVGNPEVCKTLVIDTADWAERMCVKYVCQMNGKSGLEDFGYGKGYTYLSEEFSKLLYELDKVIAVGINVVFTAHAQLKKFEQPDEMGAYDIWTLKLEKKTTPLLKEWADMILFANYKTIVVEDSKTKSKKAQGGKRVMYTVHNPCWDAKNRDGLPEQMEFSFDGIAHLFGNTQAEEKKAEPVKEEKPKAEPKPKKKAPAKKKEEPKEEPKKDKPMDVADNLGEPHIVEGSELPPVGIDYSSKEYEGLIPELLELMKNAKFTAENLKKAVAHEGIVPESTAFTEYPPEWQKEYLVGEWAKKWAPLINELTLPF